MAESAVMNRWSMLRWHCVGFFAGFEERVASLRNSAGEVLSELVQFKHALLRSSRDTDQVELLYPEIDGYESRLSEIIDFLDAVREAAASSGSEDAGDPPEELPEGSGEASPRVPEGYTPGFVQASTLPREASFGGE